ncbi:MAG: HAD family hydrolase [Gammaproteobacteria bacterium]|nr:HAD family hydrolase [Gammaproteobacteria bacterium]
MKPAALLFDLDDTLICSPGGDHLQLWVEAVEDHAHHFEHHTAEELYNEIQTVADEFWSDPNRHRTGRLVIQHTRRNLVAEALSNLGYNNNSRAEMLADDYHHRRENDVVLFDGTLDTLAYFREQPVKLVLITNGGADVQRSKINKFQLDQYFDLVLVEGEFGKGKPEPEVYLHILDALDVKAEHTWIVGDNLEWEIRVPQSLGLTGIWHDFRSAGLPSDSQAKPDHIINRIEETIAIYNRWS